MPHILNRARELRITVILALGLLLLLTACQASEETTNDTENPEQTAANITETGNTLVIYAGRSETLIGPLIEQFRETTSLPVEVRYGDTAEMAAMILEEGRNSPADIFFGQDAGALGALARENRTQTIPQHLLSQVESRFRSPTGDWIGITGRARVVIYNTDTLTENDLPDDIYGFCESDWRGRLGWAPTNGSFQSFVTALRVTEGEERTRQWLQCIRDNNPLVYPNNRTIVAAAASNEIAAGFVNHYYLYNYLREQGDGFAARNYHPRSGDAGAMINLAGVAITDTADNPQTAIDFVAFLLSEQAQRYFAEETSEYPLIQGVEALPHLLPLSEIDMPDIDLSDLDDLRGTLALFEELGLL